MAHYLTATSITCCLRKGEREQGRVEKTATEKQASFSRIHSIPIPTLPGKLLPAATRGCTPASHYISSPLSPVPVPPLPLPPSSRRPSQPGSPRPFRDWAGLAVAAVRRRGAPSHRRAVRSLRNLCSQRLPGGRRAFPRHPARDGTHRSRPGRA